jgi:energy-converting hydrogenase B subunit Q
MKKIALDITAKDEPGALNSITELLKKDGINISYVSTGERRKDKMKVYLELEGIGNPEGMKKKLDSLKSVLKVKSVPTFKEVYGKRVIVVGGGAQVSEVAAGAVGEADRHNIRGEHISIDTIPLVGEDKIEQAVRAVSRLSRAKVLVLAGSLMGGKITKAVEDVRKLGVIVISLNMAGSVPDAADLVVTDPVQAGVMAVMAISDTAEFDIKKQRGKRY